MPAVAATLTSIRDVDDELEEDLEWGNVIQASSALEQVKQDTKMMWTLLIWVHIGLSCLIGK
jgi:hypothetical protein